MQYQECNIRNAISGHPPFWTGHHDVNYSTLRGRGCSNNISAPAPAPVQAVRVKKQAQRRYEKREQLGEGEEHQAV